VEQIPVLPGIEAMPPLYLNTWPVVSDGNWQATFVTGREIAAMLMLYARPKTDQTDAKVEEPAQPAD
jgi:hypothetical protein